MIANLVGCIRFSSARLNSCESKVLMVTLMVSVTLERWCINIIQYKMIITDVDFSTGLRIAEWTAVYNN